MKLTVVTPTLKIDKFLSEARDSVARQTTQVAIEHIIVVDDQATHLPPGEIRKNVETRFLRNCNQKGPSGARNAGLDQATGSLLFFLDADDRWDADYLRKAISAYDRNNSIDCMSIAGLSFGEHVAAPSLTIPKLPQGIMSRHSVAWNSIGCPTGFSYRLNERTCNIRFKDAMYFQDVILYLELLSIGCIFWRENSTHYWYRRSIGQLTSLVPTEKIKMSEDMVHKHIAKWRETGLSTWEAALASVQIKRLSANRQRRRDYRNTILLALMSPRWTVAQVNRQIENSCIRWGSANKRRTPE